MRRLRLRAIELDIDGSTARQGLGRDFKIERAGLEDLRDGLQFYASRSSADVFEKRLGAAVDVGPGPRVHLLGSGDFHHLTLKILEGPKTEFILVVFDNHTDCSFMFPKYHCGNWMYHAARLPGCRKVIHIGSTEGHGLSRHLGLSGLVRQGRVDLVKGTDKEAPLVKGALGLLKNPGLKDTPVYISIDKDVLREEDSPGDWDNGVLSAPGLIDILGAVIDGFDVIGADITGERGGAYRYKSLIKNLISRSEHPGSKAPDEASDEKQRAVNMGILSVLGVDRCGL